MTGYDDYGYMTNDEIILECERYKTANAQMKEAEKTKQDAANVLKAELSARNANSMIVDKYIISNVTYQRKKFDLTRFRAENPALYEQYCNVITVTSLTVQ